MKEIVQIGTPVLRTKACEVSENMFGKKALFDMLRDMKEALESQKDGVAIAAPQIGLSCRIFLVSPSAYKKDTSDMRLVFINPIITKQSKTNKMMPEGCLSVRWQYGEVKRSISTTVVAYDEHGKKFTRVGGGLLSQIFQHEIDHLDGTLFIDKAKNVGEHIPDNHE